MTTFDEREKEFESRYKHDQELQFKVKARRNRLLGLWAASVWKGIGSPPVLRLIELGPGRGTMMADALRAQGRTREADEVAAKFKRVWAKADVTLAER
jgi:hypothetical protein